MFKVTEAVTEVAAQVLCEKWHEVKDEEMSEGSGIARVKCVCSQQTIQGMMSLVINAMRRQGETNGDGEVVRQERCQPQAGSIKKNSKSMAKCRQCDRSKATGTVWHKEPEQQRFKKNVKVRAEAQKVKAGAKSADHEKRNGWM